ncbi:MAG: hypothetical protein OXG74_02410 [Acidobacteria bacterium]|nr:hypothetical protein [Acidobacteriota bacterium]
MRLKIGWIVASCLVVSAVPTAAGEAELPPDTRLVGGAIDDDGQVFFVTSGEDVDDGSLLVRRSGERQEVFELPNTRVKSVRLLEGGLLRLFSARGPIVEGRRALALEILKLRADEVVTLWSWNSRAAGCERECSPPVVSGDGKMWGAVQPGEDPYTGTRFTFGHTKKGSKRARTEAVEFDVPDSGTFAGELSFFWFLDSEGQVVMVPWNRGAFIVHLSDSGSPYTVPVLQGGDSPNPANLYWQRGDRLLWAGSPTGGGPWRAYHLWDLGLSGLPAEPFWEVERKDGWKPHPERGVVRVVEGEHGYRIEHLWREPWTAIEEHHVSDWQPGSAPASGLGYGWLVSPNGQHAAVIGTRQLEDEEGGGVAFSARSVDMRWEPRPLPPVEAAEPPPDDAEPVKKQALPS